MQRHRLLAQIEGLSTDRLALSILEDHQVSGGL
jgi:hypothetical protein